MCNAAPSGPPHPFPHANGLSRVFVEAPPAARAGPLCRSKPGRRPVPPGRPSAHCHGRDASGRQEPPESGSRRQMCHASWRAASVQPSCLLPRLASGEVACGSRRPLSNVRRADARQRPPDAMPETTLSLSERMAVGRRAAAEAAEALARADADSGGDEWLVVACDVSRETLAAWAEVKREEHVPDPVGVAIPRRLVPRPQARPRPARCARPLRSARSRRPRRTRARRCTRRAGPGREPGEPERPLAPRGRA
jgi:hypothetical protein